MTLALYGKSKRRQGSLLLLGVFAVFVALLAGMSVYRSEDASAATVNLFSDSFGTNGATIPGSWTDSDGSGTDAEVTSNTLRLQENASAAIGVDTTGYTDIVVNFSCYGDDNNDDADDLVVEYSSNGGSTWTTGATFDTNNSSGGGCQDDDWRDRSVDLSAVAAIENNASFVVRFRSVGHTNSSEDVNIDDVVITGFEPDVDTDGDGVSDTNDTCPGTAQGATVDPANGCSFAQYLAAFGTGTANGNPAPNVCAEANLSFVVDRSGSISDGEADSMRGGINAFTNAYETLGGGAGSYQLTTFNGTSATVRTTGYENLSDFTDEVDDHVNGDGSSFTPTQAGIQAGDAKNGADPDQHIMFVLTDGSPNRYSPPPGPGGPTDTGDTATWVNSAAAAIAAANDARTAGFIVQAIWVETSDNMPFNTLFPGLVPSANLQFAKAVMDQIGGGSSYTTNFDTIATALLQASGCDPSIQKSDGTVDVGAGTITWTVTVNNVLGSARAFAIEDTGATLTNATGCTNNPTTPDDAGPWDCTVAGNGQAVLTLTTPLGQFDACVGGSGSNTAYLRDAAGALLAQDSGNWSHPGGVGCVTDPTISKAKVDGGLTATHVYWDIFVDNTANATSQTVQIEDAGAEWVATQFGTCTDTDFADDDKIQCTANASATMKVQVRKARPAAQCLPQTINNSATLYLVVPGADPKEIGSDGGDGSTEYTIPGDPAACDKPGITKGANSQTTQNPADVWWTVTVTNPAEGSQGPGTSQTVQIKDENVEVLSGPTFSGSATCDPNNATEDFEDELTDADGVSCSMPNASTITFTVKPAGTIARTCNDQKFNNTAYLSIVGSTAPALQAVGEEITLQGDPTKCTRNLEICKVVVGNGDLAVRSGSFNFDVRENGVTVINGIGGLNASEPNPDDTPGDEGSKVCKTVQVATDKTISVAEWGSRPTGWDSPANDAADYPKYSINGGAQVENGTTTNVAAGTSDLNITFYNREKLPTKNVTFQKYICDTLGDVSRNDEAGGVDQVGMPSISATGGLSGQLNQTAAPAGGGTAVTPSNDGEGNCHLWGSDLTKYPEETGDWEMFIYDSGHNSLLQTVNIPQGGTVSEQLLDSVLLEALKAGSSGARVEEELRTGYGFGSLKCYTDHLNQDNWEWLDFNPGGIPSETVYCIAYNVPADKEIVIEKRFIGAEEWGEGDIPEFTFSNPSIDPVCEAVLNSLSDHVYIVCTVPYDWNGTVTETPPDGWEQVDCEASQPFDQRIEALTVEEPYEVFCNQPVGDVVIVKYENVPPATTQQWNFNGTLPGAPVGLSTTGTTNATGSSSTTLTNVPAGSYTLAELQGQGACESGDTSSDYQTRGLVQVGGSLPGTGAVNAAPIIGANDLNVTVQKGTTTYVAFGNQGCGSVLSGANLQVIKFSDPAGNFTGTTKLAGWDMTITGTAGAATGFNATETTDADAAFFLGIPDGTYTVCETPKANWVVIGSKYNAVNQAGVCRTGVVVNLDETVVVNFYNQPRVNIEVNKTEISLATPAGAPGNGWSFTLTGCGITPQVAATGVNGKATFSNLPPAVSCSYTVTETVKGGWSAINPVQVAAPTAAGQTSVLNFTNVKIEVCIDCTPTTPTTTPTPETPTATPTPETPTATPTEEPTEEPGEGPTEATAGEKTPGPQTPVAPSAGTGFTDGGASGMNMLFALVGLLAISLGTTILALGRKSSRR